MNIISSLLLKAFCFTKLSLYLIGLNRKWQVTQWENVITVFKLWHEHPCPNSSTQCANKAACSWHTVKVCMWKSVSSSTGVTFSYIFEIRHMESGFKVWAGRIQTLKGVCMWSWLGSGWKLNLCSLTFNHYTVSSLNACSLSLKLENKYSLSWDSELL